jgi:hypothetical protein
MAVRNNRGKGPIIRKHNNRYGQATERLLAAAVPEIGLAITSPTSDSELPEIHPETQISIFCGAQERFSAAC